ncbi:UNVERIFIED_CONTAM: hypothetical protein GTU68_024733 [Idotea baltica]|nr:hypothetical protein [Idotea baltica]
MISQKIIKALNDQVAMEAAASQKYLALAIWCDLQAMEQSAQFMFRQADEERAHMMKFIDYILEMGADAVSPGIELPRNEYKDIKEVIEFAYSNEQAVTKSINNIVDLALAENDHQTSSFLQWFVDEQREEEAMFRKILDKITLIGTGSMSNYYIDMEIGKVDAEVLAQEAAE